MEFSVMLEHVQAHVAPTDVDPGAGLQWLLKILRSSPRVKRTGALLERVFMPCDMYSRYTRHKGGQASVRAYVQFSEHNGNNDTPPVSGCAGCVDQSPLCMAPQGLGGDCSHELRSMLKSVTGVQVMNLHWDNFTVSNLMSQ
ncbi:hypothetical protein D5086_010861 [Populus alba]|uniref:Uncharacterized protein n=1 Tax=Populus alba TaxID=43335 RepID=A0ACC4CBQ2_POPAL